MRKMRLLIGTFADFIMGPVFRTSWGSPEGLPPHAERLGDVHPGTRTPRMGGREQGMPLFEIVTNARDIYRANSRL